jgi:hypothetical protein
MNNPSNIESHLPLQEATFFILHSLDPGLKCDYAIMQAVAVCSGDRVMLSTSTSHSALKRLLQ